MPVAILALALAGLSLGFTAFKIDLNQVTMKYDGTYALYVSIEDGMTVNWITNIEQKGVYKILDNKGKVIQEGSTDKARVHQFKMDRQPKREIELKFGGEDSGTETVKLYPDFDRTTAIFRKVDSLLLIKF